MSKLLVSFQDVAYLLHNSACKLSPLSLIIFGDNPNRTTFEVVARSLAVDSFKKRSSVHFVAQSSTIRIYFSLDGV